LGQGDALQALLDFDAAFAPSPALRRCLYRASAAGFTGAARLRALHWPCTQGRLRQLSLLTDTDDRPLAWLHSDLLAQAMPAPVNTL
ncbi:MAG: hypothetical protein ACOVKS_12155, partial [Aquimonas sp.]